MKLSNIEKINPFLLKRTCKICNKIFYVKKSQNKYYFKKYGREIGTYCSIKCREIWGKKFLSLYTKSHKRIYTQKPLTNKVCLRCGKIFHFRYGEKQFCSVECRYKDKSEKSGTIHIKCAFCKKEIIKNKHDINKTFCSRKCRGLWESQNGNIEKTCLVCNNKYKVNIARIKDNHGNYCSFTCRNIALLKKGIIGSKTKHRSGKREDLGIYVRSSWEANYARYLNFLLSFNKILKWEYEVDTFWFDNIKKGTRAYTPDFKVYELNGDIVYHEVKGYMTPKSKTALKRMAKYHPNIKIILICKKEYSAIAKWAKFILNWE